MAAEDNAKGWFLHSHAQGRKFGPLTEDELRSYFRAGMVKSVDRLTAPGNPALIAAGDVATMLGESVPVGPPPPPEPSPAPSQPTPSPGATPVATGQPADPAGTAEERAARAAAAMNIDLATLMASNAAARKQSSWLIPGIAFLVLVVMLFVGLGMLRKLGSGAKPAQATIEMEEVAPTGSGAGFEERVQQPESAARAIEVPTGTSAPATDNNSTFVAFMSKAEELKGASNWSALVAHAREWSEAQPDRDEPLQYLAYGYTSQGSYVQAEEVLKRILGRHPDSAEARALLADNYLQAQRYDEAVLFYKQAVTATPNDARMWNNYGTALNGAGQKDQAAVALETAVKIDPTLKQAWNNLGNVYRSLGDEPRAAAAFANAR
jgi:tetratricopeptide (TPR) repeat protein